MNELMLHVSQTNLLVSHYNFCIDPFETIYVLFVSITGILIGLCMESFNSIPDQLFDKGWMLGIKRKWASQNTRRFILRLNYSWYRSFARGYRYGYGQACVEAYHLSQKVVLDEA